MRNVVLFLNFLLLTTHATYTMDPAPRKSSKERRLRRLSSLHKTPSSAKLAQYSPQNNSQVTLPNPAICITPETSTDPIQLQRTISALLRSSSGHEETQSVSPESYFEPETNLKQPLLQKNVAHKKIVPNLGLKNTGISLSRSESPTTSPRKKSSPSQHLHKKLTTSSPYGSPRETKSSHSSPRELVTYLVTYDDVIEALNAKSSKIKKTVKAFLEQEDNNPNQQDPTTGLTILHRAVLLHDEKTTEIILSHPETNIDTEDNSSRKAFDFIKDEITTYEKLFRALKAREFVDLIINALIITTNEEMQNPYCPKDFIPKTIISFLKKTLPGSLPNYADGPFFFDAIQHRKTHTLSLLQEFCKKAKDNINYQDTLGNTMWHYAAITLNEPLLKQLASNPYVNSTLRNKENRIAVQLIPASNNIKTKHLTPEITQKIHYLKSLRTLLFTRDSLEILAEKQAHQLKMLIYPGISHFTLYEQIEIEDELDSSVTVKTIINPNVIKAKESIEKDFRETAQKQGDSDLPEETKFPSYATNKFIHKILKRKIEETASSPKGKSDLQNQAKLELLFAALAEDYKQSQLILDGQIKLKHIVIEKTSEPKKDPDATSQPINDQDPLVSKSSED